MSEKEKKAAPDLIRELSGGELILPDNHFVYRIDADADEPSITICDAAESWIEKVIPLPKSLAYYLTTHHCGSMKMREAILEHGRDEIRNQIKSALRIK